jgi:hypothetical protein
VGVVVKIESDQFGFAGDQQEVIQALFENAIGCHDFVSNLDQG